VLFLSAFLLHLIRHQLGYASAIAVFLFAVMAITRILIGKLLDLVGK